MDSIKALSSGASDYVVALRRHFHRFPEVGGSEYQTQQKIVEELRLLGLEPKLAGGTGVIAEVRGEEPGKVVALRADIDALPLQDEIDRPYRSEVPGVCHACGHDGHIAMLLGAAKVLVQHKANFAGTVRLIFQPSEERFPGGALAMIAAGALEGVSSIAGAHLWQPLAAGKIGVSYSRLMAAPDEFIITVKGRGGHGSMPHQTVDSILVGAQLVQALKTITSTNIDPLEPAVVSVGMFKAGEVYNVIPDTAQLKGTVRTFNQAVRERVFERIEAICRGVCQAAGAEYKLDKVYGFPPVVNDTAVAEVVAMAAREALGQAGVVESSPVMVGEDFSHYLEQVPGAFFFVGAGNPAKDAIFPHHHPRFDIDEDVLAGGSEVLVRTALALLKR